MNLYILNCFAVIFYALIIYGFNIENRRNVFIVIAYVHLLLFHGFRDPFIYSDTEGYLRTFEILAENNSILDITNDVFLLFIYEPGYVLFNYFVSCISESKYAIFMASSFVIVSGYLYAVYKYSKSPLLSVLIIMLYHTILQQSFYVLRQHLACAIFMFALPYIESRKFKSFLIIALLACMFHYSALILVPLYFLYKCDFNRLKWRYIPEMILTFLLVRVGIGYVSDSYDRYSNYIESGSNFLVFGLFLLTTILYVFFIRDKKHICSLPNERLIISYNFYSLVVCMALLGSSMGRLTNYFSFFLCIIIPFLYKRLPYHFGLCVAVVFVLFAACFNFVTSSDEGVFLYHTILDKL